MYSFKYTEQFNGSRLKCRNVLGLRIDDMCEEKFVEVWEITVFRWSLASTSVVVHIFRCFFWLEVEQCYWFRPISQVFSAAYGFRWSSVVGLEVLLISFQQVMGFILILCGNKKEKRAKCSVYKRIWSAVTSRQNQRETQFLGGAIFQQRILYHQSFEQR